MAPYIEIDQIVTAELSPGDDLLTYTQIAAGVDASVQGATMVRPHRSATSASSAGGGKRATAMR
ncbi:hypothetical protein ACFSHP_09975 [Novosphingobium panipatense]